MLRLQAAVTDTPLGIPRLSSNLGIPHQNVNMEDGDKTRKSPGLSTMNPPDPSTAKPSILPSKTKWDISKGYNDFFNRNDSNDDDDIKIKDRFKECVFKDYKLIIKPLETKGRGRQTRSALYLTSFNPCEMGFS